METVITDSLNPFEDDGSSDCESVSGTSADSSQLGEDFVVNEHGDNELILVAKGEVSACLLYTSPSPRDATLSRMPSSA